MINIKLSYLTPFSGLTGKKSEELKFPREIQLDELLQHLTEYYGEPLGKYFYNRKSQFAPQCLILVNNVFTLELGRTIIDGDEVSLVPPVGGG